MPRWMFWCAVFAFLMGLSLATYQSGVVLALELCCTVVYVVVSVMTEMS